MRTNKAFKNAIIAVFTYLVSFIPQFILRKIFLDSLGEDYLGLNSLFCNLISYLSLVEMGIGSAIIFSLYRPFAENDRIKIKGYLDYYSRFYRLAGCIIFILGLMTLPVLPLFIKSNVNIAGIRVRGYFILFLLNTFCSYLFTYKFCILNVAQESYKVTLANTIAKLTISIVQYIFLVIYPSFSVYIIIQIIINLIQYWILNNYIDRHYKWLKTIEGRITPQERLVLIKNVKALFIHKIGSIFVFGTDNIVISMFINLSTVAKYNNYSMIISAIQGIVKSATNAITPTIGNFLVDKSCDEAYNIHRRIFLFNFWVSSLVIITLFNVSTQFVIVWLGKNSIIDNLTLIIILLNSYFFLMRSTVEVFKDGSGYYHQDRYASLFEALINLISSVLLVKYMGLVGVFLGTLISNIAIVFWIKPLITYKYVFKKSVIEYFKMYFNYCLIAIIPLFFTIIAVQQIKLQFNFYMVILNCIINFLIINGIYLIIFWNSKDFIYYKQIFFKYIYKQKCNS